MKSELIKFKEKPEKFEIEKGVKNYEINVKVKDSKDYYKLLLTVGFEGNTTLSVTSNNKSFISFNGKISRLKESSKN